MGRLKPSLQDDPESSGFHFSSLDLTDVTPFQPDELMCEWDRTAAYVNKTFNLSQDTVWSWQRQKRESDALYI